MGLHGGADTSQPAHDLVWVAFVRKTIPSDLLGYLVKTAVQTRLKPAKSNLMVVLVQEGTDFCSSALTDNRILRIALASALASALAAALAAATALALM